MNLWNIKDLPEPPIITYKTENTKIDIKHLYDVFQEGKQFFEDNKFMYAEYAVLSRVVYRMKQKFRSAKDFKALQKINKALDNFFKMNISRNLKNFMQLIPSRYKQATYLPTKNLLDYILVRLQGCVKLMERIIETCKIAAYLLDKRMHTGHFWKIAFITFSIISRLYILAKYTAKFICEFYSKLIPFSSQLENTSGCSPSYTLPQDLKQWLNVDWLEVDDEIQIIEMPTEIPQIIQFFDIVDDDDDDVQFCDEYFIVKDEDDEKVEKNLKKIGKMDFRNLWELRGFDTREDVGEVIDINDSMQIHDENSFSKKAFDGKSDIKSSLKQNDSIVNASSNTDNHDGTLSDNSLQFAEDIVARGVSTLQQETEDILIISDNSTQFENSNVVADEGASNFVSGQENSKTLHKTKEDTVTISIPDTPLIKMKNIQNGKNKGKLKTDTVSNIIESDEDTVIILPDSPFSEMIDGKSVKKSRKERKRKKFERNLSTNMQSSIINTRDKLEEKSLSKTPFNRKHEIEQNDSQIHIWGRTDATNFTTTKDEATIIIIPDTPIVDREEEMVKNETIRKLENVQNKFKPDISFDSNIFQIDENPVMALSDASFTKKIDEKLVKKNKWIPNKSIQNGNANKQRSNSVLHTPYKHPMKKKKKILKSNQNEDNTRFNEVKGNIVKKEKQAKKNNQNGGKIDNNQNRTGNYGRKLNKYERFIVNLNNDSYYIQEKKLPYQTPKSSRIRKQDRKLSNTESVLNLNKSGQQSETQSVGTPSTSKPSNPRKRKIETGVEDLKIKKLKKAISQNDKRRIILHRELSQAQKNLKILPMGIPMKESERIVTNEMVRPNKKKKKPKKKPMKTVTENHSNVPKIKKSNENTGDIVQQTKQNLKGPSDVLSDQLSPARESRIHTTKIIKSNKKRKMKKKKQANTEIDGSNIPKIKQKCIRRLERTKSSNHMQQNTTTVMNNSKAKNRKKKSKQNNP